MHAQDLSADLVEQYGDVLPPTLIATTVDAAEGEPAAREDVAALAEAALRHTTAAASS
jgi:hypothetical protein